MQHSTLQMLLKILCSKIIQHKIALRKLYQLDKRVNLPLGFPKSFIINTI
jgi:hypothetical protein